MVVHKRVHFGEKPYKCVDCGEGFTCTSQLKTHYILHKQQNLYAYANEVLHDRHSLSLNRPNLEKGFQMQTYNGKIFYDRFYSQLV